MSMFDGLYRGLMMMIGRGRIGPINDGGTVQTLQIDFGNGEVRDDIPRLVEYGLASSPPTSSDAVAVFFGGDRSAGVVIATNSQAYRMKGLASGEVAIYDDKGQSVYLTAAGIVINGGGNPVTVTNAPRVRLETALLECTGDILDNCDTQSTTQAGMRSAYNPHTHPDPQGGTTGGPSQTV